MYEYYALIRWVHIVMVIASGTLFVLRGLAVQRNRRWPMTMAVRYLSYGIDSALLAAALMLMVIVQQYPFVHAWLTVKVLLLIVYIVLGSIALKRGRTQRSRRMAFVSALVVYALLISVARYHHPLGFLAPVFL